MPVQHKDTCESGVNPIQCAYYNKDHKIVNMLGSSLTCTCTSGTFSGTIRLWRRIPING